MYNHMEHYSAHHDFFDPAAYASNPEMLASVEHGAKNRLAVRAHSTTSLSVSLSLSLSLASPQGLSSPHTPPPFPLQPTQTVFFYLNNVTSDEDVTKGGGQTNFPRAATKEYPHGGPQPYDYFVRALHTSSHTHIRRPSLTALSL